MLDDIAGTYGSRLFVAAGGVAVALLVLVAVLWLVRNRAPSPFVRGGKGRQQRLQVLDAAAIDARRRIVLIRRDGVEHLVMIGGPTDIVIESGIGDPSKVPVVQAAIAAPTPIEAIAAKEPVRPNPQLHAPVEQSRITNRQPELAAQLSPPPVQAAIEASAVAVTERRPEAQLNPPAPVFTAEPVSVAAPVERPRPPAPAMQQEPIAQSTPQERIEPVVFERKEEAAAADILDAARNRVLAPQSDRPATITPPPAPNAAPSAPILVQDAYNESHEDLASEVAPPRKLGSEFERVLEAEMTNSLTADRVVPAAQPPVVTTPGPVVPQPRRDPDMAPVTGGDADLQKEVARIFGEMSVSRDK